LLDAGADLHAQDQNGATALHRAVRTRCASAVSHLLSAGSDPTQRNKSGSTPFHLAVQNTGRGGSGEEIAKQSQRQIIEAFLSRGVSLNLRDGNCRTVTESAQGVWVQELLAHARTP
jgi:ankyrin repeat protein